VQSLIQSQGDKASYLVCDITDERQIRESVGSIIRQFEKIDILAKITRIYPFDLLNDMTTEFYRRLLSHSCRPSSYAEIWMWTYHPYIVLTVQEPEPGLAVYSSSKAAIIGLVRGTSIEAGPV
jgi:Dehydrogenases with different specificities (related to short-chain alcohol dehydrogenases)